MLTDLGHNVRLIAPEAVRPFVKKGKKNDAADAAAICEAAFRPDVKFVPVKSLEQGILAMHSARFLLVEQQTMLANAMRGLGAEFSLIIPLAMGKLGELKALVDADEAVPAAPGFGQGQRGKDIDGNTRLFRRGHRRPFADSRRLVGRVHGRPRRQRRRQHHHDDRNQPHPAAPALMGAALALQA